MCGRYAAARSTDDLVEELEIAEDHTGEPVRSTLKSPQQPPAGSPDHNVAPSKNARVCLERVPRGAGPVDGAASGGAAAGELADADAPRMDAVRQLRLMTWGLVPGWAKDPSVGARMTNARAETLLSKPAFRKAALTRRLIVPADGWYEWQVSPVAVDAKGRPRKQPFYLHRRDGDVLAMAGLYEFWRDPALTAGDPLAWLATFTIVTDAAEAGLDRVHDRAPLVLERSEWDAWLDPGLTDPDTVATFLRPREPGRFAAHPVGREVGSSRAQGPGLLRPLGRDELVGVVDPVTGEVIGG